MQLKKQRAARRLSAQGHNIASAVLLMQGAIAGRDAQIERHIKEMQTGPEADQSAMQLRNEVNESIILQLTEQAGHLDALPMLPERSMPS